MRPVQRRVKGQYSPMQVVDRENGPETSWHVLRHGLGLDSEFVGRSVERAALPVRQVRPADGIFGSTEISPQSRENTVDDHVSAHERDRI